MKEGFITISPTDTTKIANNTRENSRAKNLIEGETDKFLTGHKTPKFTQGETVIRIGLYLLKELNQ